MYSYISLLEMNRVTKADFPTASPPIIAILCLSAFFDLFNEVEPLEVSKS